ncbi:MAG TPA: hypothetical protein VNO55_05040 [Polyangia bacterium]|nr:hypothetical protein [Polyangia bacterium]
MGRFRSESVIGKVWAPFLAALLATACSAQSETGNPPRAGSGGAGTGGASAGTGGAPTVDPGSGGNTPPGDAASGGAGGGGGGGGAIGGGDGPATDGGPLTNCTTAGSELCEDFESGQLDMQRWKLNKPSASASITVDDIHAHTGKYAVHIKVVPNQQSTAMINETVTFPAATNAFYARMFVYFSPDIPVAGGANPDMHTGFLLGNGNNDRGNVQAGLGLSGFGSAKQWLSYSIFYANPKFEFGPSSKSLIAANQWQCVELFEDGSDPKTEIRQIWVDDKELTELKTDSAKAAGGQVNHLPPKWASVSFGIWEYHPIPVLSDMWIDDIRVSSKKIGCAN